MKLPFLFFFYLKQRKVLTIEIYEIILDQPNKFSIEQFQLELKLECLNVKFKLA